MLWGQILWAFRARKPLNMGSFLLEREISSQPLTNIWQHMLSGCLVCDWGIQYHLCSTYRGLWGLVVVGWSWLSGREHWMAAQARGVLSSTSDNFQFFIFLYFVSKCPLYLYKVTIQQFRLSWQSIKSWPIIVQANSPLSMRLLIVITVPEIILNHIVLHTGKVMHSRTLGLRYLRPFHSTTLHFMHIILFHRLNQNCMMLGFSLLLLRCNNMSQAI